MLAGLLVIFVVMLDPLPVSCGTYRYVDENGVMHFTGTPVSYSPPRPEVYRHMDHFGVMHFTGPPPESRFKLMMASYTPDSLTGIDRSVLPSALPNEGMYDHLIKGAARKHDLDATLIKAVIMAESKFKPNARSPKGAKGLMQIMPVNYSDLDITHPYDPAQNIYGGTKHLKKLVDRYDGDIRRALAAYNAGTDPVDRYNSIPPYPETIEYVARVMNLYDQYKNS